MNVLVWVILSAAAGLIGAEAVAWCKPLQRWLVARIVAVQHADQRERYRQEILAELESLPNGPVTRTAYLVPLLIKRRYLAMEAGGNPSPSPWARPARGVLSIMLLIVPISTTLSLALTPGVQMDVVVFFTGLGVLAVGGTMSLQRIRSSRVVVWSGLVLGGIGYAWTLGIGESWGWWLAAAALIGLIGAIWGTTAARARRLAPLFMMMLPLTFVGIEMFLNQPGWWLDVLRALPDFDAIVYIGFNVLSVAMIVRCAREAAGLTAWRDGALSLNAYRHELASSAQAAWTEFLGDVRGLRHRDADKEE